ncbi:DUF1223 domain-containing protein [Ancylobacter defluvii]|uniref:DUF1223 domain-containing protein n=1 Tax=Ancylobacter defluvii TaxID=1282440 RepID=UPI001BCB87C5|nr:DUF1223 domain-containing protein [Ancylobacter defluvii]MBS7587132.1 DUF1223 domain-containing protein [Ancylobacter defluvii]
MTGRGIAGLGIAGLGLVGLIATSIAPAGAQETGQQAAGQQAAKTVHAVEKPRAVIELFTSQGCSACPPADKLLAEIADRPDVIALTLAVDYWDYLGWKDTLAKHGHTSRQKAYAKLRGDSKMFTPQAVVNGSAMAVGNDRSALEQTLATSRAPDLPVKLSVQGGKLHVAVGPGTGSGEVWLCPVASKAKVEIGRGENEGSEVTYHNVVRGWVKLGDWTGAAASFEAPLRRPGDMDVDALAVLVQSGSATAPGPILGAALQPIP